jgi:transmembrane sensor
MTVPDRDTEDQALAWVIRQRETDFADWEVFSAWLAADPAHGEIYAAVALAEQDMAALLATKRPEQPLLAPAARRPRPRAWFGAAVAASVIAIAGIAAWQQRADNYVVETAAGMPRQIALSDGSLLQLNGDTRLTLDHNNARAVIVERGEVVFTVVHDPARPFRVEVADATLLDVGTVFNVTRSPGLTRVAVAQGAVVFNPKAEAVRLDAGRMLTSRDNTGRVELANVAPASVGAWRSGQLVYDGAAIGDVALDLSRNLGVPVTADPAIAERRFQGVITLGKDADATMPKVGVLLGVAAVPVTGGWHLVPKAS